MTQFINYKDSSGEVMFYHTVPSREGTSGFEHKGYIRLSELRSDTKLSGEEDPDVLVAECPVCKALGTETICKVPVNGGEEAQRLHAKSRLWR